MTPSQAAIFIPQGAETHVRQSAAALVEISRIQVVSIEAVIRTRNSSE
jgi:hypothetical protein